MDIQNRNELDRPFISVIVPIFNSEKYLRKCLESLEKQSLFNLEILLIDDGSTDNSKMICFEYCKVDHRFKYFYQKNQGVSAARNYGLKLCRGEYITFIDSDDWLELNAYDIMYKTIISNDVDVVIIDYVKEDEQYKTYHTHEMLNGLYSKDSFERYKKHILVDDYFEYPIHASACCCLFKQNIIKVNRILFPLITNGEDLFFGSKAIEHSKSIYYLKEAYLYHYRDSLNSASKNPYSKLKSSYNSLYQRFVSEFFSNNNFENPAQLQTLRYLLIFILLGRLLTDNYSIRYIYQEIKSILIEFQIPTNYNRSINIKCLKAQKLQKWIIDYWNIKPIVLSYLFIKKKVRPII